MRQRFWLTAMVILLGFGMFGDIPVDAARVASGGSTGAVPAASTGMQPSITATAVFGNNVALGKAYTISPAPAGLYPDSEGRKITDGYAAQWSDMVGWKNPEKTPVITVDLGAKQDDITWISAFFALVPDAKVQLPVKVLLAISDDNVNFRGIGEAKGWLVPATDKEFVREIYWENQAAPASGRYIKVEIVPAGKEWTMLAELRVLAGKVEKYSNIAVERTYTLSATASIVFPDDGKKLTDGLSKHAWGDAVGWEIGANTGFRPEMVLDLGEVRSGIVKISGGFMRTITSDVRLPAKMVLWVSEDHRTYTQLGEAATWFPEQKANERVSWLSWESKNGPVRGRYIKAEILPNITDEQGQAGWILMTELSVFAK
ncbi:MAG: hypothetical protein M1379_00460 [Firmicutes bacterium]|nr:hypothetical protein [Bacillota bacterium]